MFLQITLLKPNFRLLQAMGDWTFWLTCLLTTVILMLPVVAWRFYRCDVKPTLTDKVRLLQKHSKVKPKEEFRPFSGRRSRYCTFSFIHSGWRDCFCFFVRNLMLTKFTIKNCLRVRYQKLIRLQAYTVHTADMIN